MDKQIDEILKDIYYGNWKDAADATKRYKISIATLYRHKETYHLEAILIATLADYIITELKVENHVLVCKSH